MGATLLDFTSQLTVITCGECGIEFAMPLGFQSERRSDGRGFYCPNGHCRAYKELEIDKVKKELERAKQSLEWAKGDAQAARKSKEITERRLSAAKGVLTKTKNRIAKGKCPRCSECFKDLATHIETTHPEFIEEANRNGAV